MVRDSYMHWRSTDKGLHGYLSFGHAEEEKKKEEEKKDDDGERCLHAPEEHR